MTATFLRQMPVAKKLLLLVLIPCLLQAFFVLILAAIFQSAQKELQTVEHQRSALVSLKGTAGAAIVSLMRINDSGLTNEAEAAAELAKIKRYLEGIGGKSVDLSADSFPELKEIIADANEMKDAAEMLFEQARRNIGRVNPKTGRKLKRNLLVDRTLLLSTILNVQSLAKRILEAESSTKLSDVERINHAQRSINMAIFAVLGANAAITMLFLYLFVTDIAARLKLVASNTHKLAQAESILEPCPGNDEIAALDAALRKVAHQLEEFRKQKLAILDNAVDVVFSLDAKFKLEAVNNACVSNWGLTPDELLGRSFLSLLTAACRDSVGAQLSGFVMGFPDSAEFARVPANAILPQAGQITLEATIGQTANAAKTFEITFSRSAESALITGVARDITQQKLVAELKEQLFAIVSHDLRTPLASLSITISVITEGKRVNDVSLQEKLATIDASIQNVMALTHDLLSLAKLEKELAGMTFHKVNAYNIWLQVKGFLQPLCERHDVRLIGPCEDVALLANEEKLAKVVGVIGQSVLNHSAPGAELSFKISKEDRGGRISVACDEVVLSGLDIAQRMQSAEDEQIFDSENISLAIARAIVEKHSGHLHFAGGNRSLEISVTLPSSAEAEIDEIE